MMIATLPMYDLPELQPANDALWTAISHNLGGEGIEAPQTLLRSPDLHRLWTSPDLLLGQTCGYPLVTSLKDQVTLLTTPTYNAPGCDGALYRSAIIVRTADRAITLSDLRGRTCAVNDFSSNSGTNTLRASIAPLLLGTTKFFDSVLVTGSHVNSLEAVGEGRADVAAIDCVTWAHLQRVRPSAARNHRVLDWTPSSPGLPLITSLHTPASMQWALHRALASAAKDTALGTVRAELLLSGFEQLPLEAYDVIRRLEHTAQLAGYPIIR